MTMQITGFNPTQGPPQTQVSLTLTGMPTDADDTNTNVYLSGDVITDIGNVTVDPQGNGSIDLTIGNNNQSGDFTVVVNSANGIEYAQSPAIFTVQQGGGGNRPIITSLNPIAVSARTNTQIVLQGTNLNDINVVLIGSTRVNVIQHIGTTQVRFSIPAVVQAGRYRVYGQSQNYGRVNCPTQLTVT